jgi:hypothetical protein
MDILIAAAMARPDPNWTQADRGRVPASEFKHQQIYNSMREDEDSEIMDEMEASIAFEAFEMMNGSSASDDSMFSELMGMADSVQEEMDWAGEDFDVMSLLHRRSYNNVQRPAFQRNPNVPVITQPWLQYTPANFQTLTSWDPDGFVAMCALCCLIPDPIVLDCGTFTRAFCIYVLHRRWVAPISFDALGLELNMEYSIVAKICISTLDLFAAAYCDLVGTLDVLRIVDQVQAWSDILLLDTSNHPGGRPAAGEAFIIGAVDGRAQPTTSPGVGSYVEWLMQKCGIPDAAHNLFQRVFYNGW